MRKSVAELRNENKPKVTVQVNTCPTSVSYTCPNCEEDIEIEYGDFENVVGSYCDWCYSTIECPECDCKLEIDSSEWE